MTISALVMSRFTIHIHIHAWNKQIQCSEIEPSLLNLQSQPIMNCEMMECLYH